MADELEATLGLDTSSAERSARDLGGDIDDALSTAAKSFGDSMGDAVSAVPPIDIEANVDQIEPAITGALESVDAAVPVEIDDPDALTSTIDDAITASTGEPTVDIDDAPISDSVGGAIEASTGVPTVDIDDAVISDEIGGAIESVDASVPVTADTDAMVAEIEDAVGGIEDVDVAITADTEQASTSIDTLGGEAEEAEGQMGGLSAGTQAAGAASAVATGTFSTLAGNIASFGQRAGGAVGIITALSAGIAIFVAGAVHAKGAAQQFETSLGDMATRVQGLDDIRGLNMTLDELAVTLGTDTDAIQQTVAALYQNATSAGVADGAAAKYVQSLVALGARAISLNPNLGTLDTVTQGLSTAFAKGGPRAEKFGFSLNAGAIGSHALEMTSKTLTSELTFQERAMAGADLASQKYGGNLDGIVAKGSQNAIIQQRSLGQTIKENIAALGAPLVAPMFDMLRDSIPVIAAAGAALSLIAQSAMPLIAAAMAIAVPPLQLISAVLAAINPAALSLGIAVTALAAAMLGWSTVLAWVQLRVELLNKTLMSNPWILALAAAVALAQGIMSIGKMSGMSADELKKLTGEMRKMGDTKLLTTFDTVALAEGAMAGATSNLSAKLEHFTKISEDDVGVAQRVIDAMRRRGENTDAYQKILDKAVKKNAEAEHQEDKTTAAQKRAEAATTAKADALKENIAIGARYVQSLQAMEKQTADFASAVEGGMPKVGDAWSKAGDIAKFVGDEFVTAMDFGAGLEATVAETSTFMADIATIAQAGMSNLAAALAAQGPVAGHAAASGYAQGIREGSPEAAQAAQDMAVTILAQQLVMRDAMKDVWGPGVAADVTSALGQAREAAANQLGLTYITVADGTQKLVTVALANFLKTAATADEGLGPMPTKAGTASKMTAQAWWDGLTGVPDKTKGIFRLLGDATDQPDTPPKAKAAGKKAGDAYGTGTVEGVDAAKPAVHAAAVDIIPTGGVGAEDHGMVIGGRFGSSVAEGVSGTKGAVTAAGITIIPTGGIGAEDHGKIIGGRFGDSLADGVGGSKGAVHNAGVDIIPTGGLGAEDSGFTIGQRFGEGLADGIESMSGRVAAAARQVVRDAADAAENAGDSPSWHMTHDLGIELMDGLSGGMNAAADRVAGTAASIVRSAAAPPLPTAGGGQASTTYIEFNVSVHGVSDERQARNVGREVGNGAADALAMRGAIVAARTG